MLNKYFKLQENNTGIKTEAVAGITTFMTVSYIIFVNPAILSKTGMDFGAVMMATLLSAGFASIFMGLYANYPFALAPGMGLNTYFTYTIVMQMGYTWETALGGVFISGCIFFLLTLFKIRQIIVYAIPECLKLAIAAGIGLFITLVGLKEAGIVVYNPATIVSFGDFNSHPPVLAIIGVLIIGSLISIGIKGAILLGIVIIWIISMLTGFSDFNGVISMPPDISPVFFKIDIMGALHIGFFEIIFAFLFVDLFDTTGTLVGIAKQAGFIKKDGNFPRVNRALSVDAVSTVAGSILGTSTVTAYVESSAGVAAGGRTGLTAIITGLSFLIFIFFYPLVQSIPIYAIAPALIIVGAYMMSSVTNIMWNDFSEVLPAFMVMVSIPFSFSIATGISIGFIVYPLIKLFSGRYKEVSTAVWILMLLFVIRFIYIGFY